jgi:hypothetical protein
MLELVLSFLYVITKMIFCFNLTMHMVMGMFHKVHAVLHAIPASQSDISGCFHLYEVQILFPM